MRHAHDPIDGDQVVYMTRPSKHECLRLALTCMLVALILFLAVLADIWGVFA